MFQSEDTFFCRNRIWSCGQEVQKEGLCEQCQVEVAQFAAHRLASYVQSSRGDNAPLAPCPVCGEGSYNGVCLNCTLTISNIPDLNLLSY